jgi:hypothetical protein
MFPGWVTAGLEGDMGIGASSAVADALRSLDIIAAGGPLWGDRHAAFEFVGANPVMCRRIVSFLRKELNELYTDRSRDQIRVVIENFRGRAGGLADMQESLT